MSHALQALVIPDRALPSLSATLPRARAVSLTQGFYIVPITDEVFDSVRRAGAGPDPFAGIFWRLSEELAGLFTEVSRSAPVAYIETEYFGGVGEQAAATWSGGTLVLHPMKSAEGAINGALTAIGVIRHGAADEFDALGLGRKRSNEDWLEDGADR